MDNIETAQPDSSIQTAATTDADGVTSPDQAAGGAERSTNASEVLQRYLKAQATQISRIVASLHQYRQDVQKLEVSLIARIGDVDDDRRHAATRLQRTLQTQRDELDERLKRHGTLMAVLLLLFSLLVAGTLMFFLLKINATQDALEAQMSDLRQTLQQIDTSSRSEPDPQTRAQLDRLSTALAGISRSIERLNKEAMPAPLDLDLHLQPEAAPPPEPAAESTPESALEPSPPPETPPSPEPASEPEPEPAADSIIDLEQAVETPVFDDPESSPASESDVEGSPTSEPQTDSSEPTQDPSVMDPDSTDVPEIPTAPQADAGGDTGGLQSPSLATAMVQVGDRPFTVQLIGFHSLEALERFATDQVLPVVYYYRQETYQGRPWFVLIHSLHKTQEAAEDVVARLPPALANLNIWIRRLKPDTELIEIRRLGS